jgi:hypothetical protein
MNVRWIKVNQLINNVLLFWIHACFICCKANLIIFWIKFLKQKITLELIKYIDIILKKLKWLENILLLSSI